MCIRDRLGFGTSQTEQVLDLLSVIRYGFDPFIISYDKRYGIFESTCALNILDGEVYTNSQIMDELPENVNPSDKDIKKRHRAGVRWTNENTKSPSIKNIGYKDMCPAFHSNISRFGIRHGLRDKTRNLFAQIDPLAKILDLKTCLLYTSPSPRDS